MRVIGIDPGPEQSALVLWDGARVICAQICDSVNVTAAVSLYAISVPAVVACEHLQCFGMAVGKEVFETAYHIGAIRKYCELNNIQFERIYRSDEKMHLCGSMRAKDSNIRQALIDRFGPVGTKKQPGALHGIKADLWSALAVAVTWWDRNAAKVA